MTKEVHCPNCRAFTVSHVLDTRIHPITGLPRRRRECTECGGRYSTMEVEASQHPDFNHPLRPLVVKFNEHPWVPRDGRYFEPVVIT